MKHIIFIFVTSVFYSSILGQNITRQDSSVINYKINQGKLTGNMLDSGTYTYSSSKHHSFIEFTSFRKEIMMVKYRVEKLSNNHSFFITKTYSRDDDSTSTYFLAIDSKMLAKINGERKHSKTMRNSNIYMDLGFNDSNILSLFVKFINEHNLKKEYLNFNPNLFVAWLKIEN